jgi:hypothetical protein
MAEKVKSTLIPPGKATIDLDSFDVKLGKNLLSMTFKIHNFS